MRLSSLCRPCQLFCIKRIYGLTFFFSSLFLFLLLPFSFCLYICRHCRRPWQPNTENNFVCRGRWNIFKSFGIPFFSLPFACLLGYAREMFCVSMGLTARSFHWSSCGGTASVMGGLVCEIDGFIHSFIHSLIGQFSHSLSSSIVFLRLLSASFVLWLLSFLIRWLDIVVPCFFSLVNWKFMIFFHLFHSMRALIFTHLPLASTIHHYSCCEWDGRNSFCLKKRFHSGYPLQDTHAYIHFTAYLLEIRAMRGSIFMQTQ